MAAFGTKFVHNSRLAGYLFVLTWWSNGKLFLVASGAN